MADSTPRFADLPPRQKIAVIIFLLIIGFVVWEVIGMFRGGGGGAGGAITPIKSAQPMAKNEAKSSPPQTKTMASNSQAMVTPAPASIPAPAPLVSSNNQATVQQSHPMPEEILPPSNLLAQQDQVQNKYVTALNELQMLKIQKEIAETSQAIVTAKLATVTAEKSITDVLGESTSVPSSKKEEAAPVVAPTPSVPAFVPRPVSYSVHSVSMEQHQWHAVVKFKDNYYDVSVGDMLPPDGSVVKDIDQRGVTLETAGFEQKVPLTITDAVPAPGGKPEHGGSRDSSSGF